MSKTPIRLIQISDIHLFENVNHSLLGVNTQASFEAVVELIKKEREPIDLIILSGDLSQDGSVITYERLSTALKELQIPVYFVPGNHDEVGNIKKVFPSDVVMNHQHVIQKNWLIILLNSQIPGEVEGYLDSSELDYMQHCLKAYPHHHAMVVFHHHPVPMGSLWLENLGLQNAKEFWQILSLYPNRHTVLFGHVHQEFEAEVQGTYCYSSPSTCIQFKPKQADFILDPLPPGYRWINLYEDGRLETGIRRVEKYIGVFDANAKGY